MSATEEFNEYVLELLEPLSGVTAARMFGGVLLKVDGQQLGVLFSNTVYFNVKDKKLQERYKREGSQQFTYTRKDTKDPVVIQNWWSVPEYAMDNSQEMVRLAEEVLAQGT